MSKVDAVYIKDRMMPGYFVAKVVWHTFTFGRIFSLMLHVFKLVAMATY